VFLDRFPACSGRTVAAMVGVADRFFTAPLGARVRAEPARLVTVSRLSEPRKNIDLVLRALGRLKDDQQFSYRIIGEGSDRSRLAALAEEIGIADRVKFLGRVPEERMIRQLATSDLFVLASSVLPASHEGFGIVYLEANACGTPVLAARVGGAAEAVVEGVSGMLIDSLDIDTLAGALRGFLRGDARFDPARCRAHARRFSWDKVVSVALPHYQKSD
jgi:glycosyltransferase involved in cell wall biosynthesis